MTVLTVSSKSDGCHHQIDALRCSRSQMNQADLAECIGATHQIILAIEQGCNAPSLAIGRQNARVLGVKLDDVFSYPNQEGP